jgi:hypothetical protein
MTVWKFLLSAAVSLAPMTVSAVLPTTNIPTLQLVRTIQTNPLLDASGNPTTISVQDPEGSHFINADEYWLVADKGLLRAFRITTNGVLVQAIDRTTFSNAPRIDGGPAAGASRTGDFENVAFAGDLLYIFTGPCCTTAVLPAVIPAVFRMDRSGGGLVYQDLPSGLNFTAAAARLGTIYVGINQTIQTYDFSFNAVGPALDISGLSGNIKGMDFTPDGLDLIVVTSAERLFRVNADNKMVVSGWDLDLTPFGILDSRSVVVVPNPVPGGYDQLYVSDGSDTRPDGDPLRHAVFVFDVLP